MEVVTTCARQRCKTRTWNGYGLCKTHATRLADENFARHVRGWGPCMALALDSACAGAEQCAHIISRSYRVTRWDPANAVPLCAGHHTYFTHRPLEWEAFIERTHPGLLADLKKRALNGTKAEAQELMEVWL